jgi:subtilisin-like proprotein convertase family protein
MNKIFIYIFFVLLTAPLYSQVIYDSKIDSVLNLVSAQSISRMNKELSGDTVVNIGGIPQKLYSRYYRSPEKLKVIQYLDDKFTSFGLTPRHMVNNDTNTNVYAVKTGSKYPNQKFIISGHYDNILWPVNPGIYDTVHGADDDASGVCAMLEAARLLANMNLDYTVIFIAHDNEEIGLYGAVGFADSCYFRGDSILGVLNLDMIAYDSNNDFRCMIAYNNNSLSLSNDIHSCNQVYQLGLNLYNTLGAGCDVTPYWNRGYKGVELDEDYANNINPFLHKITETFDKLNVVFFYKMVKADIAILLTWALDSRVTFGHIPIPSGMDTNSKTAEVNIHLPVPIASGVNAPRLYYKIGNGNYNYVNAFFINGETYKFHIPGNAPGSKISYYFAAQDAAGNNIYTYPTGGSGINPPGTTPPPSQYVYYVWATNTYCANKIKPITDLEWTEDTIHISQQGIVKDLDVSLNLNHTNDGDLLIKLQVPGNNTTLSQFSGQGGQNFINTIFDDSATIPIYQGVPPFTGRFKPYGLLTSTFINQQLAGDWILRIYDVNNGNTGNLLNWCITFKYESTIGVTNINSNVPEGYKLFQNYPNPFNPSTKIKFGIVKNNFVILKVYDLLGREIQTLVNENLKPGVYEATFNGEGLPSGIYFYILSAGDFSDVKRMVFVK